MSLAEALAAISSRQKGPRCAVEAVRDAMSDEDRATFDNVVMDLTVPATILARAATESGYTLSDSSLTRHRRGDCRCDR